MSDDFFLIVTEGLDETQEKQVLAAAKQYAKSWWHEVVNIWLVKGGRIHDWNERLSLIAGIEGSRYFVFKLPPNGSRQWGGRHLTKAVDWIRVNYADVNGSISSPSAAEKQDDPWGRLPPPPPPPGEDDPWGPAPASPKPKQSNSRFTDEPPF